VDFSGRSNVIFDGFEFTGDCTSGGSDGVVVNQGSFTIAERLYFHGWSVAQTAQEYLQQSKSHPIFGH
jgi:hypothetical protein